MAQGYISQPNITGEGEGEGSSKDEGSARIMDKGKGKATGEDETMAVPNPDLIEGTFLTI